MPDADANGFLVTRRPDGFGDVFPLLSTRRYVVGRSSDCDIVLRDDLGSRKHAELVHGSVGWTVHDNGSLNGSFVNDARVVKRHLIVTGDEVRFGHSQFLFVRALAELPALPDTGTAREDGDRLSITRRQTQTRYLPTLGSSPEATQTMPTFGSGETAYPRLPLDDGVAVLYRLAVDMAAATDVAELAELVLDAVTRATPAEASAVLTVREGDEFDLTAHRIRPTGPATYHKVSSLVSHEVLTSGQAVLAEDVGALQHPKNRDSITDLRATSLICAPVSADGRVLGLLHLYSTGERGRLTPDDLEFTLAAARQLGVVWQALQRQSGLSVEVEVLKEQLHLESELVGGSGPLKAIEAQIARVAETKTTVLIRGESGVGKELVARALHFNSPRRDRPFVCLNCAALTESLLESELFGHEKGAFTGATERMRGKFESADQGTIFLDEIGEMAPNTQAKLLRVLEGQPFERVGGNVPIRVDVRVVAATNRPLEDGVRDGTFRRDLYFRLQVVQIDVPPLRDRADDVPVLADHFLKRFTRETGRKIKGFTPAAVKKLQAYHWPGNVRELRNAVERAVALAAAATLDEGDIWLSPLEREGGGPAKFEPISLEEMERRHIERTLEHTGWNKSKAAEILGVERSTLDRKIKAYELKKPD